ncbi:chlorite dismutase family protein [Anaerolineales bacterium HSG25]|nr:chlorite dismutase family protein [Anaerolineales bacterium HSG25]
MKKSTADLDLRERGKGADDQPIYMNRRLFMQFLAFGDCLDTELLIETLNTSGIEALLYADVNDSRGVGLLTFSEEPEFFATTLRDLLNDPPFMGLTAKPEYTMMGRTYALGYETDLEKMLIDKPREKLTNPELRWGIWYPLRRKKEFETLSEQEQRVVLMEHGGIGMRFGRAGYATDIRLACHGLDKWDNDFVVGVLGHDLYPLSVVVQRMRRTKQTSLHLESLGPFFIGKVIWQSERE